MKMLKLKTLASDGLIRKKDNVKDNSLAHLLYRGSYMSAHVLLNH